MKKKTIKISICIPTYNRPELIKKAIDSALAQTCSAFEIVICDNSENSETEKVVSNYSDKRIRYYRHKKNIGIAGNWNALINMAEGDYLKFLNDDDELLPECIEVITSMLLKVESQIGSKVGVISCAAKYVNNLSHYLKRDRPGTKLGFCNFYVEPKNVAILWCFNAIPLRTPTHMLYNRKIAQELGGFKEELDYTRDVHLALQIAAQNGAVVLDEIPLVRFRLHQGQDVKGIHISVRLSDLLATKQWSIDNITSSTLLQVDPRGVLGEVCLRESALMIKNKQFKYAFLAITKWMGYASVASVRYFITNNIFRTGKLLHMYKRLY